MGTIPDLPNLKLNALKSYHNFHSSFPPINLNIKANKIVGSNKLPIAANIDWEREDVDRDFDI